VIGTRTVLVITGMRSNACRERIAEVLEKTPGVEDVDVNLHRARAMVVHQRWCSPSDLIRAVVCAGYDAVIAVGGSPDADVQAREAGR
jgi:copper chaperone CopZ